MNTGKNFASVLRHDLSASVVVFFVALPLCLGIALASGAPLISGLIAGIVGGIVVGSLSGSPLGVSGPAAGLAVIVLAAIQELGSFDVFLVAVILAGLIQVALGFARAGVIAYYFPSSVITGMLSGIGIVIFLKQIPHALGYDKDPEGDFSFRQIDGETSFTELGNAFQWISPGPASIAAVSLAILILWESPWLKRRGGLSRLPGPLVAVVTGVALQLGFASMSGFALTAEQLVSLPVAEGFGGLTAMFTFPDFTALTNGAVYKTALVLAIVASLETLLCVEATDKLDPLKRITPTGRELKAQGVGNVVSGLLGGIPVTQVIVRSSANIQSGGKTKASAVIHGFLLILSVIVFPTLMNRIPLASLAAVLLVVGYKLAKPALFARMFHEGIGQFVPFVVTIVGIVFIDLLVGVGLGLVTATLILLYQNYKLPFEIERLSQDHGRTVKITLAQNVSFLNKASLLKSLDIIPRGSTVKIDGTSSVYVHHDVIEIINDFVTGAAARDITVAVRGLDVHEKGSPSSGASITVSNGTHGN